MPYYKMIYKIYRGEIRPHPRHAVTETVETPAVVETTKETETSTSTSTTTKTTSTATMTATLTRPALPKKIMSAPPMYSHSEDGGSGGGGVHTRGFACLLSALTVPAGQSHLLMYATDEGVHDMHRYVELCFVFSLLLSNLPVDFLLRLCTQSLQSILLTS
jgi:hypothetical protein